MKITKKMTLLEIVEDNQKRIEVFKKYDEQAGTCLMCNHLFESIEDVCKKFGLDAQQIIEECSKY